MKNKTLWEKACEENPMLTPEEREKERTLLEELKLKSDVIEIQEALNTFTWQKEYKELIEYLENSLEVDISIYTENVEYFQDDVDFDLLDCYGAIVSKAILKKRELLYKIETMEEDIKLLKKAVWPDDY